MTTATVRTFAPPPTPAQNKLTLLSDTGARIILPFAPLEAKIGGMAARFEEVQRDGQRPPLLIFAGHQLKTIDFDATIVDTRYPDKSAETYLYAIELFARSPRRVWLLNYGTVVGAGWQIIDYTADVFRRRVGDNVITGFTATLSLKVASGIVDLTSPLDIARPKPVPKLRTAVVRPGETPGQFAARVMGSSSFLAAILAANDLRDPRALVPGYNAILP